VFPESAYHTQLNRLPDAEEIALLASLCADHVFRTDFTVPGFALLSIPAPVSSPDLRQCMVLLKEARSTEYHKRTRRYLAYLSLLRFDQQNTTRFHRDGGPDESYLMLGYEPSTVTSVPRIADYSRAALAHGLPPAIFLREFNPLFPAGEEALALYITELRAFDISRGNILLLNNNCLPPESGFPGVLHQATILEPMPGERRIINSTMIVVSDTPDSPEAARRQRDFLTHETLDEG
jgi:hypothetical protein